MTLKCFLDHLPTGTYLATCVDKWFVSQGKTEKQAIKELIWLLRAQDIIAYVNNSPRNSLKFTQPAPDDIIERYHKSQNKFTVTLK